MGLLCRKEGENLRIIGIDPGYAIVGVGVVDYVKNTDKKVRKALAIGVPEEIDKALSILSKKYEGKLIVNKSSKNYLEVIDPLLSKGEAVRKIATYYNIPLNEVIAVGDSLNDLSLIDGEWHGVCVGDGMEEVRKVAKEVTLPFKEQPIKYLLRKYCL